MKKIRMVGWFLVAGLFVGFADAADTRYISKNWDQDQLISFGEMDGFYRSRRVLDSTLNSIVYMVPVPDFLCHDSLSFPYVRKPNSRVARDRREVFMADDVILVRLLGGWGTEDEPQPEEDLFYLDGDGEAAYRWNLLYQRIDPLIERGYSCSNLTLVMDSIPYDLVRPGSLSFGPYGQSGIPYDFSQWKEFIRRLCLRLKERYGEEESNGFRFRMGSEAQDRNRFNGTEDEYLKYYDYSAAAIKEVLPGAKVGAFNRGLHEGDRFDEVIGVGTLAEHCAKDRNLSTGEKGIPFDFMAHSFYYKGYTRHPDDFVPQLGSFFDQVESVCGVYRGLPREMMEFGPLGTEVLWEDIPNFYSFETGVRGAAQVLETQVDYKKIGVSKVTHYMLAEKIGDEQMWLFRGTAWLYMICDYMRGGQAWKVPFDITGGSTSNSVETFVSVKDDVTYLLVSCWSVDRKQTAGSTVQVTLPEDVVSFSGTPGVQQILLEETNSVYDVIWEDFRTNDLLSADQQKHLEEYGKTVSIVQGAAGMCVENSDAGVAYVKNHWDRYQSLMEDSLILKDFTGNITNSPEGLELTLAMPSPSVYVVKIMSVQTD